MLEKYIKTTVNPVLQAWGSSNSKHYNINNTIVVASSPRGGSTWLAEIIGSLPGYPIINEPLYRQKNPECEKYGFTTSLTYVPASEEEPSKRDYLHQIFTGANLSVKIAFLQHFRLTQYLSFRGFLVKFCHANMLLYWALHQFPLRAVFMIRHPCAVVSSQLLRRGWKHAEKCNWENRIDKVIPQNVAVDYPHLLDVYRRVKTKEEGLAFIWAMQNYIPLSQPKPHPWCLTIYERLVMEGQREVDRLFQFLGEPVPREAYERLKIPSVTTPSDSNIRKGKNQLSGWKEKLTADQIDRILDVVHQVGIDFYSDALEPEYEKLLAHGYRVETVVGSKK